MQKKKIQKLLFQVTLICHGKKNLFVKRELYLPRPL